MPLHPNATQCAYTKVDGRRCGGPAVRDSHFCHHHDGLQRRLQDRQYSIPALDDQNAVQVALMDVINGLLTKSINRADANSIIQALWLAKSNLKGLTLSPTPPDELEALLKKAREEGFAAGYEKGKTEDARRRAKQDDEDGESLAAFLLRELKEPNNAEPANGR